VDPIRSVLLLAVNLMMLVIVASVILSWLRMFGARVPSYNPIVRAIEDTADLMLRPIRNAIPTSGGGLDFTPMVALIILYVLRAIIWRL
jgi:uncharacterized protein YggT (Ycf19 family)